MTNTPAEPTDGTLDRRALLKRLGLGAAAAGAWVTPQVLFASPASAGCTPITKLLEIDATNCSGGSQVTTSIPSGSGCTLSGWVTGRNDGVTYTCPANALQGGSFTITTSGCTPTGGIGEKFCTTGSPGGTSCVSYSSISGSTITFPAPGAGCTYDTFRIILSCC